MPEELRDLFRRDLGRIDLPPAAKWVPTGRPRSVERSSLLPIPALAGAIALALVVAFVINAARTPQAAASPSPSGAMPIIATGGPPIRPSPIASASASPATLTAANGVTIRGTLPASGTFALILQRTPIRSDLTAPSAFDAQMDTLVAVSLEGSQRAKPLLSFRSVLPGPGLRADNLLREQISPEGHRVVLSVIQGDGSGAHLGLVVVDLVRGTAHALASGPDDRHNDMTPAWSPNGEWIAFVRVAFDPGGDAGILKITSEGAGFREVLGPTKTSPVETAIHGWQADGSRISFQRPRPGTSTIRRTAADSGYYLVDVVGAHFLSETGNTRRVTSLIPARRSFGDWRVGEPAFVGVFSTPSGTQQVLTADGAGNGVRVAYEGAPGQSFAQARWRPASDEFLFVTDAAGSARGPQVQRLMLGSTDISTPRTVVESRGSSRLIAEWTPDGREVVYLVEKEDFTVLHLIAADGTNDRMIEGFGGAPGTSVEWLDLAVLRL